MHSLCCVLPIICFFIGLTTAGQYLSIVHEYEIYLVAINLIAIGVGYYMYYLHKYSTCNHKYCHSNKKPLLIISGISLILLVFPLIYHALTN